MVIYRRFIDYLLMKRLFLQNRGTNEGKDSSKTLRKEFDEHETTVLFLICIEET